MRPTLDRTGTRVLFALDGAELSAPWDAEQSRIVADDYISGGLAAALAVEGMTAPDPYVAPWEDTVSAPPQIVATAFGVSVAGGDITGLGGAFNVLAAEYLGLGNYRLFYTVPVPEQHFVVPHGGAARWQVAAQDITSCTLQALDAAGDQVEASTFNVVISSI